MGNVKVSSLSDWFGNMWGEEINATSEYPFRLRALIAGYRVTPRHSMFEGILDFGMLLIPKILNHDPLQLDNRPREEKSNFLFVFPERWMSVHEQQSFIHRIRTHPEVSKFPDIDIVTQEALIVGSLPKGTYKMFQLLPGDSEAGLLDYEMR